MWVSELVLSRPSRQPHAVKKVVTISSEDGVYNADLKARRGAQYLDEAKPDWWRKINKDLLDMANFYSCLLGQLYGDYSIGREKLGIGHLRIHRLGFYTSLFNYFWLLLCGKSPFKILTEAWRKEIAIREAQASQHATPPPAMSGGFRLFNFQTTFSLHPLRVYHMSSSPTS